ncbi:uncharacterized protein LOC115927193 isoform X1 [Strongylocentrotus purpuratus]|uniref:Uncharacterized protein n=1 Tax=Strongylocentrotus purpuratus TaxID=7668 RepID=A0A7M7T286_STRPU|nr:uncharacterized protein LOC115927193 isoform X1 [Strongylocentrotus purpuratus]
MDASKRSLYEPAPLYSEKETRRPLAQGRLTNDTVLPESLTVYASPSVLASDPDTVARISHNASSGFGESAMTPARHSMASLNLSHRTPSLSSDISTSLSRSSPTHHRYAVDRSYSPPRSPSKPSPSDFLELSDSDREYRHTPPTRYHHASPGSPVLLVDASGHRYGEGQAEVEVRTASMSSPAKVICHTLSSLDNDIRNAGYTEEAARVHIDSVPSVTILADADSREGASVELDQHTQHGLPGQSPESPVISRESSMASHSHRHGDTDSTASTLKPNETSSQQVSQDAMNDLTSESERPGTAMSVDDHRGSESTKKKKKVKGKFVQSRYMQSQAKPAASEPNISMTGARPNMSGTRSNISGTGARFNTSGAGARSNASGTGARPANAGTTGVKSTRPGSSRVRSSSSRTNNISVKRTDRSKSTSEKSVPMRATRSFAPAPSTTTTGPAVASHHHKPHPSTDGDSQFSTPVTAKKGKRFASTPAVNTSILPGASHINASAIGASTSILGANMSAIAHVDSSKLMGDKMRDSHDMRDRSRRERGMSGDMTGPYSGLSVSPNHDSAYSSLGHKQVKKLTQSDLDVMYARYIQAVYLDSKMKKIVADKEKETRKQMYGMWHLNEEMYRKKAQLELKLARLKHANTLDQHLDIQETGLGPVTANLAQFKQEHSTLAHALDTTRHQVEMTDILLPQDKDAYHDALERVLSESEHLLGEISMATRNKQPRVEAFSSAISMLENTVASESEELRRCQELLAATSSLATHETSLRVQDLEQRSEC